MPVRETLFMCTVFTRVQLGKYDTMVICGCDYAVIYIFLHHSKTTCVVIIIIIKLLDYCAIVSLGATLMHQDERRWSLVYGKFEEFSF